MPDGLIGTIPSNLPFDLALVAVDLGTDGQEKLVFCEPTISFGTLGMLSPNSADRDALLLDGGGRVGRALQSRREGSRAMSSTSSLTSTDGSFGWATATYEGVQAARHVGYHHSRYEDEALQVMSSVLGGFFEDMQEVVDAELPKLGEEGIEKIVLKGFLATPSLIPEGKTEVALPFPASYGMLEYFGGRGERLHPYFQEGREIEVRGRFHLPEGWAVSGLADPLELRVDGSRWESTWKVVEEGRVCEARFRRVSSPGRRPG